MDREKAYESLGIAPVDVGKFKVILTGPDGKSKIEVTLELSDHLRIDDRQLDENHIVLPDMLAYYTGLQADTARELAIAKLDLVRIEAKATHECKAALKELMGRGATQDMTKAAVDNCDEVIQQRKLVAQLEWQDRRMKGYVQALFDKRTSIDQLTNNRRKEFDRSTRDSMRTGLEGV